MRQIVVGGVGVLLAVGVAVLARAIPVVAAVVVLAFPCARHPWLAVSVDRGGGQQPFVDLLVVGAVVVGGFGLHLLWLLLLVVVVWRRTC